ncbi:MAG: SIS domain-containing protein, partial [Verrucomicrobiota bacterium]
MPEPSLAEQIIAEHTLTIERFRESCLSTVEELADRTIEALRAGHKICFFGNGGSAADSQHLAAEFVVRFTRNRRGLPSIALTTDTSILTASANDYGFESVFARQVEALCTPGDLVVGISTSGSSGNVIAGLQRAQDLGITTVAFTG